DYYCMIWHNYLWVF
nr:immunoglobulin light chain junction region [Macaca mulatta]